MTAARDWLITRARSLAASLATIPHARTVVAGCTAVVLVAGIAGLALYDDDGDTDVAANRDHPTDLTHDSTDSTTFDEAPPSSLLPPVATVPGGGTFSSGATTSTTARSATTTTTTAPAAPCSGAASVVEGTGLWLVDKADGRVRQVANEEAPTYVWSPDGAHLAYLVGPQADRRLVVLDVASGTSRTVYEDLPVWAGPSWTSDSSALVFAGRFEAGRDRLLKVPVEGGAATALHDLGSLAGDVEVRPGGSVVFTDGGTLAMVAPDGGSERKLVQGNQNRSVQTFGLSPDGDRVAYADRQQLVIMKIEDASTVNVSTTEASGRVLSWSTDGARVAFVRTDAGREVAVTASWNGGGTREVGSRGSDFTLAPSGREIGWVADKGTTPKATVTSLASGAERQLGTKMWQPTFAPKGDDIAVYATVANQARPALCLVGADGTPRKLAQLAATAAPYSALAWSPSGATLAFAALG